VVTEPSVVLVVEDDRTIVDLVRANLLVRGYSVIVSRTGEGVIDLVRDNQPDLVLLDLMLPGVDGFDLCRYIRAESSVGIIVVSARRGEQDKVRALNLGADDYMTKPFSYVVLAARLRALLRRGAVPRPAQLRAGDLVLDPASRRVRRGEADIELTAREFAMLEYLMRRPGQVVAKTELLEHVWDSYDSLDLNVVEVYAGYVRRKIDAPFGRGALQTVRGAGYRLAADGG
jgi:DNA-binding response OmpR family regulator